MANNITTNPLVLDSAAATAIVSNLIQIKTLKGTVDNGGADNDTCVLSDKNGKVVYEEILNLVTSGNLQAPPITFNPPLKVDGLIMTTLSGGKLYVYWDGQQPVA